MPEKSTGPHARKPKQTSGGFKKVPNARKSKEVGGSKKCHPRDTAEIKESTITCYLSFATLHAQTLALPPGALHAQIPRVCNDPHVETLQRPSGAQRPPLTIYLATTRDTDERATKVLLYIWTIVAHSQTNVMLADQDIHGAYTHLMWRGNYEYP